MIRFVFQHGKCLYQFSATVFWVDYLINAGFLDFSLFFTTAPLAVAAVAALIFGQRIRESIAIDTYTRVLYLLLVLLAFF